MESNDYAVLTHIFAHRTEISRNVEIALQYLVESLRLIFMSNHCFYSRPEKDSLDFKVIILDFKVSLDFQEVWILK